MLQLVPTNDKNLQSIQDNVNAELTKLQFSAFAGGQLLYQTALISGADNIIPHALGYSPKLILALVPNVDTRIWSPTTATLLGSNVSAVAINLRCSTTCVVSIWVK